ncbi:vWA domain-containing protein [Vibrio maritimus]|uniref:vWA domain-containing protein n=1 Tax=Vibrio maritimus TaxID=990268 RepID=UPI004068AB55
MNYSTMQTIRTLMNMHHAHPDCKIIFRNGPCATDGINLFINAGSPDDHIWLSLVESKVTHEIGGHQRHSSFSEEIQKFLMTATPTFRSVWNIIEDCYIESQVISEYPGTFETFEKMTRLLFKEGYWKPVSEEGNRASWLFAFLLYSGRGNAIAGQSHLTSQGDNAKQLLIDDGLSPTVLQDMEDRMVSWGTLESTEECIQEAIAVMTIMEGLVEPDDQTPPDSEDQPEAGENAGGDGDSEGSDDSESSSQAPAGKGFSRDEYDSAGEAYVDMHDILDDAINEQAKDDVSLDTLKAYANDGSTKSERKGYSDYAWHLLIDRESDTFSRRIAAEIEGAMWSKEIQPRSYDDSGIHFDQNLLAGVAAGNNHIFYQENEVESSKSAFVLLVDRSGSMGSDDMHIANVSAAAIAKALDILNIPNATCYFDNRFEVESGFDKSVDDMHFDIASRGGTSTEMALERAADLFDSLAEIIPKKQILVITDAACDASHVRVIEAQCKAQSIEVASIQLRCGEDGGVENFVVLNDIEELPELMATIVREKLLDTIAVS